MPRNRKQKKAAAAAAAEAAKEAEPDVEVGSAAWFKAQGNDAFVKKDFSTAIDMYSKAVDLEPDNKVYYSNRAAAHEQFGSRDSLHAALADATKCVELDETWPKGYFRKGSVLKALGRFAEATEVLTAGRALQPDNEDFAAMLGELAAIKVTDGMIDSKEDEGDNDKFDDLERWLTEGASEFPLLYMKRYSANNRGVHCRVDIDAEKELMRIPRKFLITVEMGKACDIGKKMSSYGVDVSATKHCYVAVFCLLDRKAGTSFYQPYYNILPEAYDNMPIFWDEEQLGWLEGSYLLTQIDDRKKNIKADYEEIIRAAPEFEEAATLEEFSWARMMVASRNFGIKIDDTKTDALVPYADMLNHFRPRETRWTFENKIQCFTITSIEKLKAGQQVYDSYGKKCNSRFLLNYGFAVENNRDPGGQCHNEVRQLFTLRGPGEDKWHSSKIGLLNGGSTERSIRVGSWYDHESTLEAFSFVRFMYATGNELLLLPQIGDDYELGKNPIKPISCENEIQVLRHMKVLFEEQIARYPTTLEEDMATLESNVYEFGSNHRNVLVVLRGEKEVCKHYVDLADQCIPLLESQWKDVKKTVNKNFKGPGDINAYVTAVVVPLVRKKASTGAGAGASA